MKYIIAIIVLIIGFMFIPMTESATLTSDFTATYLEVATGATLSASGFNITVGGNTGATLIYGFLDAHQDGVQQEDSNFSPAFAESNNTVGTESWTNPTNSFSSNNVYATTDVGMGNDFSEYLKVTHFGFSIPSRGIILGIEVAIERNGSQDMDSVNDNEVKIVKRGTVGSQNKASATNWPTTDATENYGGASDLWGTTWIREDINRSDFGLVLRVENDGGADFEAASVDHIQISVTYIIKGRSTIFTQISEGIQTYGSGAIILTGTGHMLLTGTGSDASDPYHILILSGSLNNLYIDNGLIGYWKLDDGTGSLIAKDSSRFGKDGTLTNMAVDVWSGSVSIGPTFFNPANLTFDGSNDYVTIADDDTYDTPHTTWSAWVYQHTEGNFVNIISRDNGTGIGSVLQIRSADDAYKFHVTVGGTSRSADSSKDPVNSLNLWTHLAGTYDGETIRIYINGTEDGVNTIPSGNIDDSTLPLVFGRAADAPSDDPGERFDGILDDIRIYNRALAPSEIQSLANGNQNTGSGYYILSNFLDVNRDVGIYAGTLDLGTSARIQDFTVSGSALNVGRNFINHAGFVSGSGGVFMSSLSNPDIDTINIHSNRVLGSSHFNDFSKVGSTGTGEFYTTQAFGLQTANTTQKIVANLVVDRSNEPGTKDFIVIGSWAIGNEDVSQSNSSGALIIDGEYYNDNDAIRYEEDDGVTSEMVMTKISLDNSSHTVQIGLFTIDTDATDEAIMQSANLIVWEMPAWMYYKEDLTETDDNDSDSAFETSKLEVTYDAFGEDVLIVATADINWSDASSPGAIRLVDNDGTEIMRHEPATWSSLSANDDKYHPISMIALLKDQNGRDLKFGIQTKDDGTGDDTRIKNVRMFALPISSFDATQRTNPDQSVTATSYTDILTNPSRATGSYIAFMGSQFGSVTFEGNMQIKSPTSDSYEIITQGGTFCSYDGTDDGSEPCSMGYAWGTTGSGGIAWAIEGKLETGGGILNADRNSITVIEVGSARNSLTIDHRSRQSFSGSLILYGDENFRTDILSMSGGTQAQFNLGGSGTQFVDFLNVTDNDASPGIKLFSPCQIGTCIFNNTTNWDTEITVSDGDFTLIFEDTFTESSNTPIVSHSPDTGDSWTSVSRVSDAINNAFAPEDSFLCIASAGRFNGGDLSSADVTYGSADYVVESLIIRHTIGSSFSMWLSLRIQDSDNMYLLQISGFHRGKIVKIDGGTPTDLSSFKSDSSVKPGNYIYFRVLGDTLSWGTGRPSIGTDTELQSITDTTFSSTGKAGAGIGRFHSSLRSNWCNGLERIDNFRVYTTAETAATPVEAGGYIMFME